MDMQNVCKEILDEVDGSLGCVVIDMQTGLTVAGEYRQGTLMNPATVNLVSVVSTNMFHGKLIQQFEGALAGPYRSAGPQGPSGFVREVQMTTEHTSQFMAAIPGWAQGLLVLVTDKTVSVGLGWMAVHRMIGRLGDVARSAAPVPFVAGQRPNAPAPTPGFAPHVAVHPPVNEPYAHANRYAPTPLSVQPHTGGAAMPSASVSGQSVAASDQMAVDQQPTPPATPPSQAASEKKRPAALGPRVAMFRKK